MIGVILAGGLSTRFESEKALHELDGKPFFHHVYDAMLGSQLSQVVISTNQKLALNIEQYCQTHQLNTKVIVDDTQYTNQGPLAGILSVMQQVETDAYFVVSVDTPFITSEAINYLMNQYETKKSLKLQIDAIVYQDDTHIHRTIGIYKHTLKPVIQTALTQQNYALKVLTKDHVQFVDVSDVGEGIWYENINTKNDLNRALKRR
ncbi:molybdenum cofactor guanylyltransferase [Macrococcus sp. DPC7161]|uniref:molybdenum cofactor guanylyltransferase n=1 Tax=Macrococcus sp. DPC7161 TaxID=2507060 RepID=UPI00100B253B|nr:molybdenum cofactor guanylyltransferase [Macrococcus sp. DPC7161]RXK18601.1 molybdenum cofactor guanylyltransferase [Macrococcus sp. DPC7161]